VEISIRDNGIVIPPEVKDEMFNPFFTPGVFTEFKIILPRTATSLARSGGRA